jgi:hypothetical protein
LQRLEKGQDSRAPRFETLRRIGEVLGKRVEVVFCEKKRRAPVVVVK